MSVALVVGARPNYMKAAPLLTALEARGIEVHLVHTGQHYDPALYQTLFEQLDLRAPDARLGGDGGRPSFAEMVSGYSAWCERERPAATIVVGDVDSTAATALASHYAGAPAVHVEAGLRSFDRTMPEEINRILADGVSSLLLASEPSGVANLEREGRKPGEVVLVGNLMIDTLLAQREAARTAPLPDAVAALTDAPFGLLTLHRPSNVDTPAALRSWREALAPVAARLQLIFPVHPRSARSLDAHGERAAWQATPGLHLIDPVGYLQALRLQEQAAAVLTDSGGMQEECSVLGTPCLTLRENTERPITLERGTSVLVGRDGALLGEWVEKVLVGAFPQREGIPLWDGQAAGRAAEAIERFLRG
jgi:UDP-N-acetylglucosamine 2-epimerase (non-hydrolysing)